MPEGCNVITNRVHISTSFKKHPRYLWGANLGHRKMERGIAFLVPRRQIHAAVQQGFYQRHIPVLNWIEHRFTRKQALVFGRLGKVEDAQQRCLRIRLLDFECAVVEQHWDELLSAPHRDVECRKTVVVAQTDIAIWHRETQSDHVIEHAVTRPVQRSASLHVLDVDVDVVKLGKHFWIKQVNALLAVDDCSHKLGLSVRVTGVEVRGVPERAEFSLLREPGGIVAELLQPSRGIAEFDLCHAENIIEPGIGDDEAALNVWQGLLCPPAGCGMSRGEEGVHQCGVGCATWDVVHQVFGKHSGTGGSRGR